MNLPEWTACAEAHNNGKATALEQFIYEYEPAAKPQEGHFRETLAAVIKEAIANALGAKTE